MKKVIAVVLLCAFISGCATPYKKSGFMGGYSDTKIQDDIFKVKFKGNAFIGRDEVADFALLRCAELTLNNEYKYFIVLDEESYAKTGTFTTPVTSQTTGQVQAYGSSGTYQGQTTYSGGQTYSMRKPRTSMMIKCFKEKPDDIQALIYDAEQVQANLKESYKIE